MKNAFFPLMLLALIVLIGCSGGGNNPLVPAEPTPQVTESSHSTWGLWQFTADPAKGTLDAAQLRTADMHLNALPFLEPPASVNLKVQSVKFNGNIVDADVLMRHPFLGLVQYTGFDVCGILITNGSLTGFDDSSLVMAAMDDTRLLNADGYSRWWNPAEFPHGNTMFSYKEGLLGTPDSTADYNCTLNAYKYFADGLAANDPLTKLVPEKRGMFSAGQENVRHYTIQLGTGGLIFNYAVDACWKFPTGGKPWTAPDSFAPEANRPEAVYVNVTENINTLWNAGGGSGGELSLSIDVYDWFNAGLNKVRVESPGNFSAVTAAAPIGGGVGYSTYEIDIPSATPVASSIDLLITVESEVIGYQNMLPDKPVSAYFTHTSQVSEIGPTITVISPNGGEVWNVNSTHNITWQSTGEIDTVKIVYSTDGFIYNIFEIIDSTENDGTFQWIIPNAPSTTVRVMILDPSHPSVSDVSDNDFTIKLKPSLKIISPNGGEVWDVGSYHDITWESTGDISDVKIGYSKDGFVSDVHQIVDSTENDGVFQWQVPDDPSTTVRVGIVDNSTLTVYDISDNDFTIKSGTPTITVISPNGGEIWKVGSFHDITWSSTGDIANVKIEYSKDGFLSDINEITAFTENDGSFQWEIPDDPSTTVRVRISDATNPLVFDISDGDFTIAEGPTLKVIIPNGGEVWIVDSYHTITWESTGDIDAVSIGYSKDNFVNDIHEITPSTENDGAYKWKVPNDPSTTVRVGIIDIANPATNDTSDNDFTIKLQSGLSPYWNQFMHDSSHGGRTAVNGPQSANYTWAHEDGLSDFGASIVEGSDGTIYYGASYDPSGEGKVWAVNTDGSTKWIYFPSFPSTWASPLGVSTDNSTLYVDVSAQPGGPGSPGGMITGVDTVNGNEIWTYSAWSWWFFNPSFGLILDNGDLVTVVDLIPGGPGQNSVVCIDQNGGTVWSKNIGFTWWTIPAQGPDGTIYVNGQPFFGLPRIVALDPDSGATTDFYEYDADPFTPFHTCIAVRTDGKIIFGAGSTVYCLDANLDLAWSYVAANELFWGGIGIGPDDEVYACSDSDMLALTSAGSFLWSQPFTPYLMSPAIGADGKIYTGSTDGVSALDPTSGTPVWEYDVAAASSPIIAHDGSLYVVVSNKLSKFEP